MNFSPLENGWRIQNSNDDECSSVLSLWQRHGIVKNKKLQNEAKWMEFGVWSAECGVKKNIRTKPKVLGIVELVTRIGV